MRDERLCAYEMMHANAQFYSNNRDAHCDSYESEGANNTENKDNGKETSSLCFSPTSLLEIAAEKGKEYEMHDNGNKEKNNANTIVNEFNIERNPVTKTANLNSSECPMRILEDTPTAVLSAHRQVRTSLAYNLERKLGNLETCIRKLSDRQKSRHVEDSDTEVPLTLAMDSYQADEEIKTFNDSHYHPYYLKLEEVRGAVCQRGAGLGRDFESPQRELGEEGMLDAEVSRINKMSTIA